MNVVGRHRRRDAIDVCCLQNTILRPKSGRAAPAALGRDQMWRMKLDRSRSDVVSPRRTSPGTSAHCSVAGDHVLQSRSRLPLAIGERAPMLVSIRHHPLTTSSAQAALPERSCLLAHAPPSHTRSLTRIPRLTRLRPTIDASLDRVAAQDDPPRDRLGNQSPQGQIRRFGKSANQTATDLGIHIRSAKPDQAPVNA
jgi:hypothetical protein